MTTDFRPQVQQLQRQEGNKYCIDCNAPNPQWASVSFGTFFCLECSGQHRSLGVHISFVRSVQMDSWREEQYRKMENGGNQRALEFFKRYGIASMPIKQKYHTRAAELYREQLTANCEGRPYQMPPPSPELSQPAPSSTLTTSTTSMNSLANTSSNGLGGGGGGSGNGIVSAAVDKSKNEEYFARKGLENESRSADLPPSQGGKYAGFGSNYVPPARQEPDLIGETWSSITKGFSMFSSKAVEVAKIAATQAETLGKELNESVIKPTAQRIQDPNFRQNFTSSIQQLGKQVVETGDKGFHFIADAIVGKEHYQLEPPQQQQQRESTGVNETIANATNASPPTTNTSPITTTNIATPPTTTTTTTNIATNIATATSKKDDWSSVKDDEWASF